MKLILAVEQKSSTSKNPGPERLAPSNISAHQGFYLDRKAKPLPLIVVKRRFVSKTI
jgi:hypothetical protein